MKSETVDRRGRSRLFGLEVIWILKAREQGLEEEIRQNKEHVIN